MEVAAGVFAAEQALSTAVEGSAAAGGAALAFPTAPLKAIFSKIGTAPSSGSP